MSGGTGRIVAVVQARHASRRLPGKVLRNLAGRPMLGHLLDALTHCRAIDGIVLATSGDRDDDRVAAFAEAEGIACHRGPLDDVAARLVGAADMMRADALVRISGDSPLLDPALVARAVELYRSRPADLVSNVIVRSFPKGQSVEVVSRAAMARALPLMTDAADREHVTTFFYAHPEQFAIHGFAAERPRPALQLSVDEPADLARCEAILATLGRPAWQAGWEACVRAHDALAASSLG